MAVSSRLLLIGLSLLFSGYLSADEIRVAVASNFSDAIKTLSSDFEKETGHKVNLIFGATGRHYAQIKNGAPFDLFFAADSKRPKLLEKEGLSIAGSRFTYALGKLVLWSPKDDFVDPQAKVLETGDFHHIAIANPKLAPYGKAAKEFLTNRKLWKTLKAKAVRGENIAQAFQFVKSGNAQLGLVALSHIKHLPKNNHGSVWIVPESLYSPIKQQAILLKDSLASKDFIRFIKSERAQESIKNFGYGLP